MRVDSLSVAVCIAVCVQAGAASAQPRRLALSDVLARAREQTPEIASARLAVEEARARLAGASLRFQQNPEVDTRIGNRQTGLGRFTDFEIGLAQPFEPGGRRDARISGANAAIAQRIADVTETTRVVLRAAAAAYYRLVHAKERINLLVATEGLASRVYGAAERRFKAGDIALLDLNVARASLARVRADLQAAEATRTIALSELKQLLNIDDELDVAGTLAAPGDVDLAVLQQAASQRPELRALEAGVQEAEADIRLGGTFSKPNLGLGITYSRESGDHIVLGGLKLTLPVFAHGQELTAAGTARALRLRSELAAARTRIRLEVQSSFAAYGQRLAAVRVLENEAIPGLEENEALSTRSFEVGQIGLPDLLLIRREIFETRTQYLDTLLEAALARVELDASAALLR